jgi:lipopolysaccharide export system permease protein
LRRIDRLIIGELIGPWVFGVAIFTTLIMVGTYMFKITDYLVNGIPVGTVVSLSVLLLPGIMVKTFSMALLLATLLSFGRLSGESEIVALRAAGASLGRIMLPVGVFGLVVAIISFWINEQIVPAAAFKGTELVQGIDKKLKGSTQPIFQAVHDPRSGKLLAMIMAKDFNLAERSLKDAWAVAYDRDEPKYILHAPGMTFTDASRWKVEAGSRLFSYDLGSVTELGGFWPKEVAEPPNVEDIVAAQLKDLDSFSMREMQKRIKVAKANVGVFGIEQVRNLEYGYYNKIALPLAALIFALVGAPLGIRNHRAGTATGFALSILIIFSYMMLTRVAAIWALGGKIHPSMASFAPLIIGLLGAVFLIWKKNT